MMGKEITFAHFLKAPLKERSQNGFLVLCREMMTAPLLDTGFRQVMDTEPDPVSLLLWI